MYANTTTLHKKQHEHYHYYIIDIVVDSASPHHIASAFQLEYIAPVADLGYHLYRRPKVSGETHDPVLQRLHTLTTSSRLTKRDSTIALAVREVAKQEPTQRLVKRSIEDLGITDPMFNIQWHLHNTAYKGHDLNVTGLWEAGITGKGVTVALIDDGLDYTHEALRDNFVREFVRD
jgi:kexin